MKFDVNGVAAKQILATLSMDKAELRIENREQRPIVPGFGKAVAK
jgi:hypothetical protein